MIRPEQWSRVTLVGAGRLGRSILRTMPDRIAGVVLRDHDAASDIASLAPRAAIHRGPEEVATGDPGVIWIVTGDGAIGGVAEELARARAEWGGVAVVHSSGGTSLSALDPLADAGAITLALHPNGSFTGQALIPSGLVWGLTARDPAARAIAEGLLAGLDPQIADIADDRRALYHAAASAAANYSMALFAIASDLYQRAGLSAMQAREVVAQFLATTAGNGLAMGPRAALTGPISRGDIDVLRAQMRAVELHAPEYLDVLMDLAVRTAWLAADDRGESVQSGERGVPDAQSGQRSAGTEA